MLRTVLVTALIAALTAAPVFAQQAGVTAAVNQSAKGRAPGAVARTIVLGDNVVVDEQIDTNADGLVQILLADGTTFTVGPNSSLTIDRFVYDPAANTAQVTASVSKGVFRFIGGRTSKTEDGVQINTPVGTVGIRGAVVNFSVGGSSGTHFDLVFGREVTLAALAGGTERLFRPGYSIAIGQGGASSVIRTPAEWTSLIQAALTAKPGTSGGAGSPPSNQQVAQSGVSKVNSEASAPAVPTGPVDTSAIQQLQALTPSNLHDVAQQVVDSHAPTFSGTFNGFSAGIVHSLTGNTTVPQLFANADADDVEITFDAAGRSFGGTISVATVTPLSGPVVDVSVAFGSADPAGNSYFVSDDIFAATGDGTTVVATIDGTGPVTGSPGAATLAAGVIDGQVEAFTLCETCDYLQWGVWVTDVPGNGTPAGNDLIGTWVTGNVTELSAFDSYVAGLPTGTTATYNGLAFGFASDGSNPGLIAATGDMTMTYDFGARTGEMDITNFDGRDFVGMDLLGGPGFSGNGLIGAVNYDINGGFVTGHGDPAAGVIGNCVLGDGGWQAAGVFAGTR